MDMESTEKTGPREGVRVYADLKYAIITSCPVYLLSNIIFSEIYEFLDGWWSCLKAVFFNFIAGDPVIRIFNIFNQFQQSIIKASI